MPNEYSRAFENLRAFGISETQADDALDLSRNLIRYSLMRVPSEVERYGSLLKNFLRLSGIEGYLNNSDPTVTLDHAIGHIFTQDPGSVVGITGKPAAGKTTLCKHLSGDRIVIVDEFWQTGTEQEYQEKQDHVKVLSEQGKVVVVGACQLTSPQVTSRIHLVSPPDIRKHNLETRLRGLTDQLRVKFFEAYEANDDLIYGLEQIHADIIADATRIRY